MDEAHHHCHMRITLTLDEDVARLVHEVARREQRSAHDVINDALRCALGAEDASRYRVVVHDSPLRPGIDELRVNQLADNFGDISSS